METPNKEKILKQKIEYAQRWDDMLNGLKHVENEARGKRCCYCNIYRSGLNSTCSDCPLFPKLCNLKKGTPSTYTHIWELMEALREECSKLRDGILQDIEQTKKTSEEEKPRDSLKLGVENLMKELEEAFPEIGFDVQSKEHDSGWGKAIKIVWIDGPSDKKVQQITDKYEPRNNPGNILPLGGADLIIRYRIIRYETESRAGQILCSSSFATNYRGNEDKPVHCGEYSITIDDYVKKNLRDISFDSKGNIVLWR